MQLPLSNAFRAVVLAILLQLTCLTVIIAFEHYPAQQFSGSAAKQLTKSAGVQHDLHNRRSPAHSSRRLAWQQHHLHWRHKRPAVFSTVQNHTAASEHSLAPENFRPSAPIPPKPPLPALITHSGNDLSVGDESPAAAQHASQQQISEAQQPVCGLLTAEKLAAVAVNLTVMLMVSDYSTASDLLHHWLGNVQASGISYYLVAAADDATSALMVQHGLQDRCYRLAGTEQRGGSHGYFWASDVWEDATWLKVPAALQLLHMGYNVMLSDVDVMWLADPLPFVLNETQADFLVSLDAHYSDKAVGDLGLEKFSLGRLMNTGVYFARARIQVLNMYERWLSLRQANHDQEAFKQLMITAGPVEPALGTDRLGKVLAGTVVMGQLPLSRFMHSYSYSVMQLHKLSNTPPYEVHMVFGYGHKASKLYRLRDAGLGHDPVDGEYYNPAGGILTFDLVPATVPVGFGGWTVEDSSQTEDGMEVHHNRAIDFQLQQLYHALGLALALNRTLVMPAMQCFCARGWFPNEACRLVGDKVSTLPFRCTGDQVFDIEALMNPAVSVAGNFLRVRPPGFASDFRLPAAYLQQGNKLVVNPGGPACKPAVRHSIWQRHALLLGTAPADDVSNTRPLTSHGASQTISNRSNPMASSATSQVQSSGSECLVEQQSTDGTKQLVVPAGYSGELMAQMLAAYAGVKWLHFKNVTALFAGFKTHSSQQAFEELLKGVVAEWCCRRHERVMSAGVPDGHLHQIRPWGAPQRFCARRLEKEKHGDRVHTYLC